MSYVYEEIWVEKATRRLPDLPERCPVCRAFASERQSVGRPWESVTYQCGGGYKRKPQIQNHTDKWWGHCPLAKAAAQAIRLPEDTPVEVLRDAILDCQ